MHRWKLSALAAAAFVSAALASTDAAALTLGRISVQSALGENLRAEIAIPQITPEEMNSLVAQIAPADAFRAQGIDYSATAQDIQVELHRQADGTATLRLTSSRPVNEPFVDVLLQTQWNAGQMLRSYTLLVDPARTAAPTTAAASAPAPSIQRPAVPAPASVTGKRYSSNASGPSPARPAPAAASAVSGDVRVRSGDTAGRIARAHLPAGVSLDQMLIALLQSNPQAFVNGNVNRLRAGAVLQMPDRDAALATTRADARQMVAAQSRDFNAYRRGLAAKAPKATVEAATRSLQGQVQTQVQEPQAAATSPDKLTLSKGALEHAAEAQLAAEKQAQDQDTRLSELQRNLAELNELAKGSAPTAAATGPATHLATAPSVATGDTAPASVLPSVDVSSDSLAPAASTEVAAATPTTAAAGDAGPGTEAPNEAAPETSASAAATPASEDNPLPPTDEAAAPADAEPTTTPAEPTATPPVAEPAAAPPTTDPLRSPWLPVGAALLALIAAVVGHSVWKRRRAADHALAADTPAEPVPHDAGAETLAPDAAPTADDAAMLAAAALHSTPDPLEEADDLLAFGRDVQAEAVLEKALGQQPDNPDILLKLAEIYRKRHDVDALEQAARSLQDLQPAGQSAWERVVDMGLELSPQHPYFSAVRPASAPVETPSFGASLQAAAAAAVLSSDSRAMQPASDTLGTDDIPAITPPDTLNEAVDESAATDIDALLNSLSEPETPAAPSQGADIPASLDLDIAGFTPPATDLPLDITPPDVTAEATPETDDQADPATSTEPGDATPPALDLGSLDLDLGPDAAAAPAAAALQPNDPLSTKLDLAQEFHAIGDTEGARSLIEEVLAEASGATLQRAQDLLSQLD